MSTRALIILTSFAWLGACQLFEREDDQPRTNQRGMAESQGLPPPTVHGPRIAEVDIPTEPAFVGEQGVDAYGYATERPDQVALLNLLRLGRFAELDRFIAHYQTEFEADFHKEHWPDDALSAFFVGDPRVGDALDEWVAAKPESFAAWAARGNHRFKLAMHYREGKFAAQTSDQRMKAMAEQIEFARADFDEALKLRPKYLAAHRRLLQFEAMSGTQEGARAQLDKALEVCPQSYILRAHYVQALAPRWGGSIEAMRAYVKDTESLVADNPKLALLPGFIAVDQCKTAREAKRFSAAHKACDAALRHGDELAFLLAKVDVHLQARTFSATLPLLDRALAIAPQARDALDKRFFAHVYMKNTLLAAEDLIAYRQVSPIGGVTANKVDRTVAKLRFEGQELHDAGKYVEAAQYFALGLQLAPDDADLANREAWNQKSIGPEDIQAQLAAAPDDYALHLRIDHGLAASRRFDEVVKIWDTFIAAHPKDPRAYVERGGAKWQLGQKQEGIADMQAACDLGMQSACADVPEMQARAGRK